MNIQLCILLLKHHWVYRLLDINHLIKIAKEAERILEYKLPGQVMHAGERLKKYSLEDVKTAKGN